jgi:hypothetical protein
MPARHVSIRRASASASSGANSVPALDLADRHLVRQRAVGRHRIVGVCAITTGTIATGTNQAARKFRELKPSLVSSRA